MSEFAIRVLELLASGIVEALRSFVPPWLIGTSAPESHGASRWARWNEHWLLGRLAIPERAYGDGIVIGFLGRRLLQSPAEDNVLLLGVQRAGKTSTVVVPTLLTWSGACVATSTKHELVTISARRRRQLGPVWVFSPLDREHFWVEELGLEPASWNPITSLTDCGSAAELADNFTAAGKFGHSAHWYLSASNLITALAMVEHECGGDMATLLARLNRTSQKEYAGLASSAGDATAADLLLGFARTPDVEAGSIASTARSSLGLWLDPRIAATTKSSEHELDIDRLLAEKGTLYLVAPSEEAERCRPLFSALIGELLRRATARARFLGGVLSPRLLLALDEAANFARIPRLAGYASSGPGQGIQLLLSFHDLAQLEAGYGPEKTRTIWNNCRARLLLPGQGDLQTLDQFSRAIGDETRIYRAQHSDRRGSSSSEQRIGRPLCTRDELRRLGQSVLIYASAPPARLSPRRWDEVPHFRRLVDGGASVGSQRCSRWLPPFIRRFTGRGGSS